MRLAQGSDPTAPADPRRRVPAGASKRLLGRHQQNILQGRTTTRAIAHALSRVHSARGSKSAPSGRESLAMSSPRSRTLPSRIPDTASAHRHQRPRRGDLPSHPRTRTRPRASRATLPGRRRRAVGRRRRRHGRARALQAWMGRRARRGCGACATRRDTSSSHRFPYDLSI